MISRCVRASNEVQQLGELMHNINSSHNHQQGGFTLIELSIVLVIIGLIVGGVLVGQDLIKAAEIRATVGQVEKYNAAINTFRTKYNGIPGDIVSAQATAFGLFGSGMTGAKGLGDGNGQLQAAGNPNYSGIGETLVFWRHLSDAGLVDGSYGANLASGGAPATANLMSEYLPTAKLGRGNYWTAAADAGQNYYVLGGVTALATTGDYTFAVAMTPIETFNIDVKLDDGAPNTGVVQARGANASAFANFNNAAVASAQAPSTAANTASSCTTKSDGTAPGGGEATAAANVYNRAQVAGNTPNCMLRFRFN
ncbi:MAG: prepilin-type N-terminal cleavage/methylation domain-containing protein [Pirellulales bacterium]|nr:prepilin-type N-terminal cleavage/methylation domain-containing protein [Pirellulales bacterium]